MNIKPDIFKAYDIRGRYPDELNEETALTIAAALGRHFKSGKIVVAYDTRLSSPQLYAAAIEGLMTNPDLEIEKIDLATTPMFYFLANQLKAVGGIMITASHNPKEYNGLKVVGYGGLVMSGKEIYGLL